ncbi:uncharacterized protein [Argopecten irradians]|uniref:uncharacterized protein n=1 Tax=Argopecten irradians TaxID=31199 RepID=UPI0037212CA8
MVSLKTFLLLALCGVITTVSARCHPYFGPAGGTKCVQLPEYNGYQYATCLTDSYIQEKSKNKHACEDSPITEYCYYQCMYEVYDECDGPSVRGLCSCDPNDASKSLASASLVPLLEWCFSPEGNTCSWYKDCLQKRYPYPGSSAEHAVTLAKKFCNLFNDQKALLSTTGQNWVGAVSKCLQFSLVPILRPWESLDITCKSIKSLAFASQSECFAGLSYCTLSFRDQMKIFWTIKNELTDTFVDAMKGFWEVVFGCLKHSTEHVTDNKLALAKVVVKKQASMERSPDVLARQVADAVALKQKWATEGLLWYGFREKAETDSEFNVNIVLSQKSYFDLNAIYAPSLNLTKSVTSLGQTINSSLTCLQVNAVHVDVISMAACENVICESTFLEATTPPHPKCTGSSFQLSGLLVISVGMFRLILFQY